MNFFLNRKRRKFVAELKNRRHAEDDLLSPALRCKFDQLISDAENCQPSKEELKKLQENYPVAIVSNKPDSAVKALCADYFPGMYALGERTDCPRKPAADMVFAAMRELGIDRCIYVGDTEVDVLTAKNAGMPCLCVLWGFRDKEELEAAGGIHFCEATELLQDKIEEIIPGQ